MWLCVCQLSFLWLLPCHKAGITCLFDFLTLQGWRLPVLRWSCPGHSHAGLLMGCPWLALSMNLGARTLSQSYIPAWFNHVPAANMPPESWKHTTLPPYTYTDRPCEGSTAVSSTPLLGITQLSDVCQFEWDKMIPCCHFTLCFSNLLMSLRISVCLLALWISSSANYQPMLIFSLPVFFLLLCKSLF